MQTVSQDRSLESSSSRRGLYRGRLWALALLVVFAAGSGCKKKPPKPIESEGKTPGSAEAEMPREPIAKDPVPKTPSLDGSDVNASELGRIDLGDMYFDFDRYEVRADQRATLEANAKALLQKPTWKVIVEGHCDERGTEEYNLALGDRRAHAAKQYLQILGVAADRISTISYGKAYPADPGHDEGAWRKNRRAHFVLVPPTK